MLDGDCFSFLKPPFHSRVVVGSLLPFPSNTIAVLVQPLRYATEADAFLSATFFRSTHRVRFFVSSSYAIMELKETCASC